MQLAMIRLSSNWTDPTFAVNAKTGHTSAAHLV
jgi:hypothetical protein